MKMIRRKHGCKIPVRTNLPDGNNLSPKGMNFISPEVIEEKVGFFKKIWNKLFKKE
jgi:hypothetical protein